MRLIASPRLVAPAVGLQDLRERQLVALRARVVGALGRRRRAVLRAAAFEGWRTAVAQKAVVALMSASPGAPLATRTVPGAPGRAVGADWRSGEADAGVLVPLVPAGCWEVIGCDEYGDAHTVRRLGRSSSTPVFHRTISILLVGSFVCSGARLTANLGRRPSS
jgi:hypothetical protein